MPTTTSARRRPTVCALVVLIGALPSACSDDPPSAASKDAAAVALTDTSIDTAGSVEGDTQSASDSAQNSGAECQTANSCPALSNPCLQRRCDDGRCLPVPVAEGGCDDGDACTEGDFCAMGVCQAGKRTWCDPSKDTQCGANECHPATGQCTPFPRPDGTLCNDNEHCTVGDSCKSGVCESTGVSQCECLANADCPGDGNPCTGIEFCDKAVFPFRCKPNPGSVVKCSVANDTACRSNQCNKATGKCAMADHVGGSPCDDGKTSTAGEECQAGVCGGGIDVSVCKENKDCADDGDLCNGLMYCDLSAAVGECKINPATVVACPTVNDTGCIKNTCVPTTGACVLSPAANNTACQDGDACTKGDFCVGGACKSGTFTCTCTEDSECSDKDDGNKCNGVAYCNKNSGKCETNPASAVVCASVSDTDCVKNSCVPASGACTPTAIEDVDGHGCAADDGLQCRFELKPKGAERNKNVPCSDGDKCSAGELCKQGKCTGGTFVCGCDDDADCDEQEDGNLCNGTLFCNKALFPAVCKLNPATVIKCPDLVGKPCQKNKCIAKVGLCQAAPDNEGNGCDDGDPCSLKDHCANGVCAALAEKDCGDGDGCTTDSCKAGAGCQHVAENCDDGNACTIDLCDPKTGKCTLGQTVKDGTLCNADGSGCTVNDSCKAGACAAGVQVKCSIPIAACEQAICAPQGSASFKCVKTPIGDGQACDDGAPCTVGDVCNGGSCEPGKASALFSKTLEPGKTLQGELRAGVVLDDGSLAVTGLAFAAPKEVTATRMWTARVDAAGEPMWQRWRLMPSHDLGAGGAGVVPLAGGQLAFAGSVTDKAGALGLHVEVRTAAGELVASKTALAAATADRLSEALAMPGGGLLLLATRSSQSDGAPDQALIRRVNGAGITAWQQLITAKKAHRALGGDVRAGGQVLVAGVDSATDPGRVSASLLRLDASGGKQWARIYGSGPVQAFEDVVWLAGGGAIAAGWRTTNKGKRRWLVAVDDDGTQRWEQVGTDLFEPTSIITRAGDQLVVGGRSESSGSCRLLALDRHGNAAWERATAMDIIGEVTLAPAVGGLGDGGLFAVGATTVAGALVGRLLRTDAWGRPSCAAAGACAGLGLTKCGDGNPCTDDACDAKAGCDVKAVPGRTCASPDGCARTGVCDGASCGPSAEGRLYQRVHDVGGLKEVLAVQPDGDGSLVSVRVTDEENKLLRLDRYGNEVSTQTIQIKGAKAITAATPLFDGGFIFAWQDTDGVAWAARRGDDGKEVWKTKLCTHNPLPVINRKDYSTLAHPVWIAWQPACVVDGLQTTPAGTKILIHGRSAGFSSDPWVAIYPYVRTAAKRCLWSRVLDLTDGDSDTVVAGGHLCGGYSHSVSSFVQAGDMLHSPYVPDLPVTGATVALPAGGLLAFGVAERFEHVAWKGAGHMGWRGVVGRLTPLHKEIWRAGFAADAEAKLDDAIATGDGTLLVIGTKAIGGLVRDWWLALSPTGELRWQRVGVLAAQTRPRSVHLTAAGGLVAIADGVHQGLPRLRFHLLDARANILDQRFIGPPGVASSAARWVPSTRLPSQDVLVAGAIAEGGKVRVLALKTSAWGHSGCQEAGKCAAKTGAACADGDTCSADLCDAKSGCDHASKWSCDDGAPCTIDSCAAKTSCQHKADACDDGDACTTDTCTAGVGCQHVAITCDDDELCTTDTCDKATGCVFAAHADGAPCAACLQGTACSAAKCVVSDANLAATCGSAANPAWSCKRLLLARPNAIDGEYVIDVDGPKALTPWTTACDMVHGGWTKVTSTKTFSNVEHKGNPKWNSFAYDASAAHIDALRAQSLAAKQPWSCATQYVADLPWQVREANGDVVTLAETESCQNSKGQTGAFAGVDRVPLQAWWHGSCTSQSNCSLNVGAAWLR